MPLMTMTRTPITANEIKVRDSPGLTACFLETRR